MVTWDPLPETLRLLVTELERGGEEVSSIRRDQLSDLLRELDRRVDAYEQELLVWRLGWEQTSPVEYPSLAGVSEDQPAECAELAAQS